MTDDKPILRLKRKRPRQTDGAVSAEPGGKVRWEKPAAAAVRRIRARKQAAPTRRVGTEDDLLADLRSRAPDVWDPARPAPLAVGIHRQVNPVAESYGLSRRFVRRFLGRWTSRPSYLCALSRPGAQRFNLDGTSAEAVDQRHRVSAEQRLQRRAASAREAGDVSSAG